MSAISFSVTGTLSIKCTPLSYIHGNRIVQSIHHKLREKHIHFISRNMINIELIAIAFYGISLHPSEKERMRRYIQEVLAKIVNDIDALIGGARERLSRVDILNRVAVVKFLRQLHLIVGYKEIIYIALYSFILKFLRIDTGSGR